MNFTTLIRKIINLSGLPPDFRCVFIVLNQPAESCSLIDLSNGSYYTTKFYSLSYEYNLLQFTYIGDELIFILEELK